jgi:hypothetical protein
MFLGNISIPSSGSKIKPSKIPTRSSYYPRGCNAVNFGQSHMFRGNISIPSSASEIKPSKIPTRSRLLSTPYWFIVWLVPRYSRAKSKPRTSIRQTKTRTSVITQGTIPRVGKSKNSSIIYVSSVC